MINQYKIMEAFLMAGFVLIVIGGLLAVVALTLSKLFKWNAHPVVLALVTVSIFFMSVKAFSATVTCISDEPKVYKFEFDEPPYIQLDKHESGPKKGLKRLFVVGISDSTLQYDCTGCAVDFKRTHRLDCKQDKI